MENNPRTGHRRGRKPLSLEHAQQVMGIDWMTDYVDLAQAIPPAYTGHQILEQLAVAA